MVALRKRTSLIFLLSLLSCCLAQVRPSFGQAVSGTIIGTVTDASGGAVAGATVAIRDLERATDYQARTNTDGNYTQTNLLAGHCRVTVQSPGFEQFVADATVHLSPSAELPSHLESVFESGGPVISCKGV